MARIAYVVYALLLFALVGAAEYRGWSFLRTAEARATPRSVRENPGAYRPIYTGGARYYRGK